MSARAAPISRGCPTPPSPSPSCSRAPRSSFFKPKTDDPDDYVAIRCRDGHRYAVTNTCAANVLGYAKPGLHASGNPAAAKAAMAPLAAALGCSVEEAARQILDCATAKAVPIVEQLIAEYGLDRDQAVLVGEGGGAGALIPFTAERMNLRHTISKDAEVISSIGVALALVREVIERVIPNPQPDDIKAIKREAFDAVVRLGAAAENVEVTIEVDPHTQRVRATAMGASEMRAKTRTTVVSEDEARAIAAKSMSVPVETTSVAAATDRMRVIQAEVSEKHLKFFTKKRTPVRAVDLEGVIRIQRSDAKVMRASAEHGLGALKRFWEDTTDLQRRQRDRARYVRDRGRPRRRSHRHRLARSGAGHRAHRVRGAGARRDGGAGRRGRYAAVSDPAALGREVARRLRDQFGNIDIDTLAGLLGVAVEAVDADGGYGTVIVFADYRPRPPRVRLYQPALSALDARLGGYADRNLLPQGARPGVPGARAVPSLGIASSRAASPTRAQSEAAAGAFAQALVRPFAIPPISSNG